MSLSSMCYNTLRGVLWKNYVTPVANNHLKNIATLRNGRHGIQRLLSTKNSPPNAVSKMSPKQMGPKEGFITIYKLPHIAGVSGIQRLRHLYIFRVLPIAAPLSVALVLGGIISIDTGVVVGTLGVLLVIKLYLLSVLTTNMVGFIYTNPDMSSVQVAYLDKQGRRKDDIFPTDDLVPLSEIPSNIFSRYSQNLQRYSQPSTKSVYKLNLSHGRITDEDRFTNIFGKVDL